MLALCIACLTHGLRLCVRAHVQPAIVLEDGEPAEHLLCGDGYGVVVTQHGMFTWGSALSLSPLPASSYPQLYVLDGLLVRARHAACSLVGQSSGLLC
jgi:hypothetical protein